MNRSPRTVSVLDDDLLALSVPLTVIAVAVSSPVVHIQSFVMICPVLIRALFQNVVGAIPHTQVAQVRAFQDAAEVITAIRVVCL